jgi:membrane protein implicated in regulation of membrane protease activity
VSTIAALIALAAWLVLLVSDMDGVPFWLANLLFAGVMVWTVLFLYMAFRRHNPRDDD